MKFPGDSRFAADAEMEVELSAQDLIRLTPLQVVPASPQPAAISSDALPTATQSTATTQGRPASTALRLSPRMLGAATLAAAAALTIGALIWFAPPQRVVEAPVSNWSPMPEAVIDEAAETPTLVTNPFDASEVFELPPGLSQDEARAMVADLLLKRASERQVLSHQRS